jgi:hypothetical protein
MDLALSRQSISSIAVELDIGSRKLEDRIAMPDRLADTPHELSYELSSLRKKGPP